jgi:hypothetical protein
VPRVAVSTTARHLDHTFSDWCFYHLHLVDCIYLWLDDPAEISSPHLPRHTRIHAAPGAQFLHGSVHGNMMHRQDANANRALELCLQEKVDWLIHLDSDELLYPPDRAVLHRALAPPNGQVTFLNHEVCPHWSCVNPFRECHHFKLNGQAAFNLYCNGKTAVRVAPGVSVLDAHSFTGFRGPSVTAAGVFILHYACPSYDRWLAKYTALGDFPDYWWDDPRHRIRCSFHLASRDTCKSCRAEGSFDRARLFWTYQILTPPDLNRLQRDGKIGWFAPVS